LKFFLPKCIRHLAVSVILFSIKKLQSVGLNSTWKVFQLCIHFQDKHCQMDDGHKKGLTALCYTNIGHRTTAIRTFIDAMMITFAYELIKIFMAWRFRGRQPTIIIIIIIGSKQEQSTTTRSYQHVNKSNRPQLVPTNT